MIIHNMEQGSEAWHEIRCGRVTGTRFKALVAKDTTDTYKDLLTNIACEIITGRAEETYSNATMEKGVETEPIARAFYEEITGNKVKTCGFITRDEDDEFAEWIGISPDGMPEGGLLEIKCPLMRTHMEYIMWNKLPTEYHKQVQGQLFVTGLPFCDFMSYVEGMKPFLIRVYPEPELFAMFEQRLRVAITQVKELLNNYHKYSYDE
jgi:putative phage-type endonuclease